MFDWHCEFSILEWRKERTSYAITHVSCWCKFWVLEAMLHGIKGHKCRSCTLGVTCSLLLLWDKSDLIQNTLHSPWNPRALQS
jgi:hypothetical protein